MKKNLLKIILDACDQDKLLTALSMVDDDLMNKVVAIATGDTVPYNDNTLPQPSAEMLHTCIVNKYGHDLEVDDIVSVDTVTVEDLCSKVRVTFTYKCYKWFKSEQALNNAKQSEIDTLSYRTGAYCVKGDFLRTNKDNIIVPVDEWMTIYFKSMPHQGMCLEPAPPGYSTKNR